MPHTVYTTYLNIELFSKGTSCEERKVSFDYFVIKSNRISQKLKNNDAQLPEEEKLLYNNSASKVSK